MSIETRDRSSESGAVVGFILVAVGIAVLLAGGLYFINQRSDQIAQTNPGSTQTKNDQKDTTPATNPKPSSDDATDTTGSAPSTTAPDPSPSPAPTPSTTPQPSGSGAIAATGPADTLLQVVGAGILAGAVVRYSQSRRRLSLR